MRNELAEKTDIAIKTEKIVSQEADQVS